MSSQLFFGGIPTEPDIKKLVEAYPVEKLTPETVIKYEDITDIIKEDQKNSRWRTVTNAWRKKMEADYNIIIKPPKTPNKTFAVLKEGEKVEYSLDETRSAVKKARRSMTICARTDIKQLTEEERKKHDFILARNGAMIASAQVKSTQKVLPKI